MADKRGHDDSDRDRCDRGRGRTAAALASAFGLALVIGGCTVGPDFKLPATPEVAGYLAAGPSTPKRLSDPKIDLNADIPGEWWELLGSKRLNELIEQGLAHNADLEAAQANVRAATANALAIRGQFWPTVMSNWNSSLQQTPTQALASNAASGADTFALHTIQVSVSYAPDVFGSVRRQFEASSAQVDTAIFQRRAMALTVTSNIALAAVQQASFQGQIEATQRLIKLQTDLLDILRKQFNAGQIALTDVLPQETALAQAKLLLPPLEKQREQQRNLLAVLTGRMPAQGERATFKLANFKVPRRVPVSIPADLVRHRPDIKVAEANLRQTNAQVGVAMAARLPQITLTANGGSTADAIERLFSPGTWFWMIAGNAAQTVFDGRTLAYRQKAAEEQFSQTTAQYRGVVLLAFQNVADSLLALEADSRSLKAATAAEEAAQRNLDLVRKQVELGQFSAPALLQAQQAYLQTSLARVQAQASRLADMVALFQALGGGWWNRDDAHEGGKPGVSEPRAITFLFDKDSPLVRSQNLPPR